MNEASVRGSMPRMRRTAAAKPAGALLRRLQSFRYAFAGLRVVAVTQPNAWIHAVAAVVVVGAGIYFQVGAGDWALLALAVAVVFMAEAFNTALEFLADAVHPEPNALVGKAKDAAAAAVLLAALGAVAVGICVFGPRLF